MREKYQRLSEKDKELINRLTKKGESLNDISEITGFGKTTIYYQVKKFKPKKKKEFIVRLNDFQIGELIGAFTGDGSYYHSKHGKSSHYKVRYHLSLLTDKSYAKYLFELLKSFNLNPFIIERSNGNKLDILINSRDFIDFIKKYLVWDEDKTYSIQLKNKLSNYSNELLLGFARGLMDTDGFLNTGNAVCACISKRLIDNLADIYKKFKIKFSRTYLKGKENKRDLFYVRVRRESLDRYNSLVGFSNSYKRESIDRILVKSGVAGI